jgi:hypothetical protein
VKIPFMVRLGSPRTKVSNTEIEYLAVRPELCRRAPFGLSHSQRSEKSYSPDYEFDTARIRESTYHAILN